MSSISNICQRIKEEIKFDWIITALFIYLFFGGRTGD
jgi:hypothetical protein